MERRAQPSGPVVRVLSLLLRGAGYIAIWVAIVLAFGLLTALLPSLWRLVQPSGPESFDLGLVTLIAGLVGLFVGVWPAILGVEWLVQRNDRRARERSLRSK
jgi:predicted metal-binding membrane protein